MRSMSIVSISLLALMTFGTPVANANQIDNALKKAGVNHLMVVGVNLAGDLFGYTSIFYSSEIQKSFAYMWVGVCRDIKSGKLSWSKSIQSDYEGGATLHQAKGMNN